MRKMVKRSISSAAEHEGFAQTIIAMEKAALDRWGRGDPSGFLEISDDDVVYFDPYRERRINGLKELKQLYESLRGTFHVDRYKMLDPKVQSEGSMAVLTFNLISYMKDASVQWNATEVYRRHKGGDWKIIQSHWSYTQPQLKSNVAG